MRWQTNRAMYTSENYDAMLPKETMSIIELSYTGASSNFTHQPVWDHKLVCRYRMNQIKK